MPDNPYTRSATIEIVELVPERGRLPQCAAWLVNGLRFPYPGRYLQNDQPVCGLHLGKPGLIFHPDTKRRS